MWFDDLWGRRPEHLIEERVISQTEFQTLSRFSEVFRAAYPGAAPLDVVDTTKLQDDPQWQSVVRAAREAQADLKKLETQHGT